MSRNASSTPAFSSFSDFWQHYLSQHQHPLNRQLHVWGTIGGLVCLCFAWFYSWTWLLAVLPIGYGGAWIGHFLVERNRPLTFSYPLWSLLADYCLVAHVLTGRQSSCVTQIGIPVEVHHSLRVQCGRRMPLWPGRR